MRGRQRFVAAVFTVAVAGSILMGQAASTSAQTEDPLNTTTTSTRHVTTTEQVVLPDAAAPACGTAAIAPRLVAQTTSAPTTTSETRFSFGPGTILVGEDEKTVMVLIPGQQNIDVLTIYTTVVTQTLQGVAAGETCPAVASLVTTAPSFTG